MSWSRGYVVGSGYGIAFQAAQTPAHLAVVCAMAGVRWPLRERMAVADLGCGRGYAVNTLAAANPDWTVLGLEQDPAPLAEATALAARAGLGNALFLEADLAAMSDAELDRLPALDVVTLHGVWSWVSDEVRAGIVRLLARRLKPGGLAYLGYNALPAAGTDLGLQRLLRHLAGPFGTAPGEAEAAAARAMQRLRDVAPTLPLADSAMLRRLLADPPALEPAFVAHEFLTAHWRPVFHDDLCAALAPARLSFVGSANLQEGVPLLNPGRTELLRDIALPRTFRADVFVRGVRRCDAVAAMDALTLGAVQPLPEESPVLTSGAARAVLPAEAWAGVAALLAEGPQSVARLRARHGLEPAGLLALLITSGLASPMFRAPAPGAAAQRFNRAAAAAFAPDGEGVGQFALASPVAAGGIPANALDLALAAALLDGEGDPTAIATRLQPSLDAAGQAKAAALVSNRLRERLPAWRRFGVLPGSGQPQR